jgi:hypothetical protein
LNNAGALHHCGTAETAAAATLVAIAGTITDAGAVATQEVVLLTAALEVCDRSQN